MGAPNRSNSLKHIAYIMDGNGRWAKAHGLPRFMGHKAGIERIREVTSASFFNCGLFCVSLYAFSHENFKRPKDEIELLFSFIEEYLYREIPYCQENDIALKVTGDLSDGRIPESVREAFDVAMKETSGGKSHILNILFNYGGQQEIISSVKEVIKKALDGIITIEEIDQDIFRRFLQSGDLPTLDLLVRTSGEKRVSNCLLYDLAYAELMFVDKYWPDFTEADVLKVVEDYHTRVRRYGGLTSE